MGHEIMLNLKQYQVKKKTHTHTPEMTAPWKETHLATILSRYKLVTGEFVLFFQELPNKSLGLKGEKRRVSKHSKVRLTRCVQQVLQGKN